MVQHKDFFNLLQYEIEKVSIVLQRKNLFCMFFDPIMSSLKTGEVAFGIMGFFLFLLELRRRSGNVLSLQFSREKEKRKSYDVVHI
jgi:hypothetical protein